MDNPTLITFFDEFSSKDFPEDKPMIIFIDTSNYQQLLTARSLRKNILIIPIWLQDLPYARKYKNSSRDWNKFTYIKRSIELNPFKTSKFVWIDSLVSEKEDSSSFVSGGGSLSSPFTVEKDPDEGSSPLDPPLDPSHHELQQSLRDDPDSSQPIEEKILLFRREDLGIAGRYIGGSGNLLEWLVEIFDQKVEDSVSKDLLLSGEDILAEIFREHQEKFQVILESPNVNEISLNPLNDLVTIQGFINNGDWEFGFRKALNLYKKFELLGDDNKFRLLDNIFLCGWYSNQREILLEIKDKYLSLAPLDQRERVQRNLDFLSQSSS